MARTRILIVDDETTIAEELEGHVKALGYEVAGIASSGREAIELATRERPDLVLMDTVLNGEMDGVEAATEIRRQLGVPIIYVMSYADRSTLDRARLTELFGYVVKPFAKHELNANIEMALKRHEIGRRLRGIERWYMAALEHVGDAIIAADATGVVTVFNGPAEAVTGWSSDEAIGRRLDDVLQLRSRADARPIPSEDAENGPVARLADDTLLLDRLGEMVAVDVLTSCVRDDQGRSTGTVTVLRDATEERHGPLVSVGADVAGAAERAATVSDMAQLCCESMVRHLDLALARVWTLNATGDVLVLQASAGLSTRVDGEQASIPVGESRVGLIAQTRQPIVENAVADARPLDLRSRTGADGPMSFAGRPLLVDDRLVGVVALCSRRPLRRVVLQALGPLARTVAVGVERKRLEEQIRQSQKMEAIGQLAGGVAHDFNNLLTVIIAYSELLLDHDGLDEISLGFLHEIGGAGERAASLTRQLLMFSHQQVLESSVLDVNALIGDFEKMLMRLLGEHVVLETRLGSPVSDVVADPGQIEQVIMNLCINARDAMPEGGRLAIETSNVTITDDYIASHPEARPGRHVLIAVSDTGVGLTPAVKAHLFEPFFTTKPKGKGTGLGLATVHGIVKQSGGHISVHGEPGAGATFRVFLPATDRPRGRAQAVREATLMRGTETVLLVEDEAAVRAVMAHVLRACGYRVLEAANGREALVAFEGGQDPVTLVVTDVVMPDVGGLALAEQLRSMRPATKVLFVSGYTHDDVLEGVRRGSAGFLQKPFTPSTFAAKVRELLDVSVEPS